MSAEEGEILCTEYGGGSGVGGVGGVGGNTESPCVLFLGEVSAADQPTLATDLFVQLFQNYKRMRPNTIGGRTSGGKTSASSPLHSHHQQHQQMNHNATLSSSSSSNINQQQQQQQSLLDRVVTGIKGNNNSNC